MTRIAVLDSGVRVEHPHIAGRGSVELGPTVEAGGVANFDRPAVDAIGHGTAVTAAILDLAPDAEIYAIRVFEDAFSCPLEHVLTGLSAALDWGPEIINVSLGSSSTQLLDPLMAVLRRAQEASVRVLAPASTSGLPSYPGSAPGVEAVVADANQPRSQPRHQLHMGQAFWFASPEPRAFDDLPVEANWSGVSFAVANVAGWLAREAAASRGE